MNQLTVDTGGVCAIMVTYSGGTIVLRSVNSIIEQVDYLVVVDNHSDAATLECLERIKGLHSDKVTVMLNHENRGLAAALNQGVEFALANGFEWVLTLDQDSEAERDMVARMLEAYCSRSDKDEVGLIAPGSIDVFSGRAFPLDTLNKHPIPSTGNQADRDTREVLLIHTSGNLIKASTFRTIGLFREDFYIDQIDYEYCLRLRKANLKVVVSTRAFLWHRLGNRKSSKFFTRRVICTNHVPVRRYYIARNGLVLSRETRDWRFIRSYCTSILKDTIKVLMFEDCKWAKLRSTAKGIRDGVAGKSGRIESTS